ncbi:MAG: magnesium chelatase ATPase subunit I [Gemmatimonadetes bacterium]|nr:magnesium chelatase ATPase subunit I [Gemmatimonadota bacterium]MCB9505104.1 magnesium chelatase ATPase subunit I [Gemmatimonadales bacterium]MCA9764251.1 magnesium chelatase ATPase subunit I [Gemmatimonadota bacterium]MCB9517807.1 magnesium chelatase ATPase subunit I [Gemmatimonadales bacterium]HPF60580.1 magnesium chelatase ATPase subunit I [Gemmatimonadales bacterium]
MRRPYPFSAIVGQEEMRQALLLTAVDPTLGGVMVFGDRGTGKSTAVRALAALLPPLAAHVGCRYGCDPAAGASAWCEDCRRRAAGGAVLDVETRPTPVVDLPLGATEDRITGALDLERALTTGEKAFEPGLLARAHRGFLYIDEVNLLEDHLVDLLLDVAASGENVVEREGLSLRHPARFVLVGSGNPEEGDLRPQLLDRFGLAVDVTTPADIETRLEIVARRDAYDRDPDGFAASWDAADAALRDRLVAARARLARTELSRPVLERASRLCIALGTDGLRGELTLFRVMRALAAFEDAPGDDPALLDRVAAMALRHRMRRDPLDDATAGARVERALADLPVEAPAT